MEENHKNKLLAPSIPRGIVQRRVKILARIIKIAWSALLGAIPALLFSLTLYIVNQRIIWSLSSCFSSSLWFNGLKHPLHILTWNGIRFLCFLPAGLFNFTLDLIRGVGWAKEVSSAGAFTFYYERFETWLSAVIPWCIVGAILGISILFWAKRPFRRFLKINAMLFIILIILISLLFIERIPWIKGNEPLPSPLPGYEKPVVSLPQGLKIVELSPSDYAKKYPHISQFDETRIQNDDWSRKGEILFTYTNRTKQYRLIYYFNRFENRPEENLDRYSVEKKCPWVYSLWVKERGVHAWKLLGPFLPCVGFDDYPVLDLTAKIEYLKDDSLQWILRERKKEEYVWQPAHLRPIKEDGKIWLCTLPLSIYTTDLDHDGLSDIEEAALLTDPLKPDSDGDGICDGLDSSPLGWFNDKKIDAGLEVSVLEKILNPPHFHIIDPKDSLSLNILKCSDLRPDINSSHNIILTLKDNEIGVFRNRNGTGEVHIICTYEFSKVHTFFFGLFGIVYYELRHGPLAARGLLAICVRTLKREWKLIDYILWMVS
jgi:hypothetical protein